MESKLTTYKNGDKVWKLPSGNLHREDDPAIEYANGDEIWLICGRKHRENAPAVEFIDGEKYWYLNGVEYTEREYRCKMRSIKLKLLL